MRHLYYDQHGKQIPAALALDENGILREGITQRVGLMMRDRVTVSDAKDPTAGCRPGFRFATIDAAARDEREAARREYLDYIANAYKEPQRVRDQDTRAGEPGLIGHDEPPDRHRFDGMTVDQIQRSHQENMRRIYDEVACEQSESWRRP